MHCDLLDLKKLVKLTIYQPCISCFYSDGQQSYTGEFSQLAFLLSAFRVARVTKGAKLFPFSVP